MEWLLISQVWFGTPGEYHKAKTWLKDHLEDQSYGHALLRARVGVMLTPFSLQ